MSTRLAYSYPSNTPGSDPHNQTYYGNLSPENEEALQSMKKVIQEKNLDLKGLCSFPQLHEDLTILRYLRANSMNVEKSILHIENNLAYRKEMNIEEIMSKQPHENLGAPLQEVTKHIAHWQVGHDKTGRPVLYKQFSQLDASSLKKVVPFESFMKYHMWEQEVAMKMCLDQSHKTGTIIETITCIIDIKDMRLSQVTRDFLHILRLIGQMDASQYPEVLGKAFIINAPSAFPMVWKLIKMWLDPVVAQKISILGGPNDWRPKVLDFIGEENMPSTYGGKLPPLSLDTHPYAAFMASASTHPEIDYWTGKSWQLP